MKHNTKMRKKYSKTLTNTTREIIKRVLMRNIIWMKSKSIENIGTMGMHIRNGRLSVNTDRNLRKLKRKMRRLTLPRKEVVDQKTRRKIKFRKRRNLQANMAIKKKKVIRSLTSMKSTTIKRTRNKNYSGRVTDNNYFDEMKITQCNAYPMNICSTNFLFVSSSR